MLVTIIDNLNKKASLHEVTKISRLPIPERVCGKVSKKVRTRFYVKNTILEYEKRLTKNIEKTISRRTVVSEAFPFATSYAALNQKQYSGRNACAIR